jgi:hypothetical protein
MRTALLTMAINTPEGAVAGNICQIGNPFVTVLHHIN